MKLPKLTNRKPRRKQRGHSRTGVAVAELAFVLPVLLILVFGTIEICQRIFLRQSAVIVAYEGARLAARGISLNAVIEAKCVDLLTSRRIRNGSVSVTPANILSLAPGAEIQVRITVPWADNTPTRFILKDQGSLVVNAVMLRE